MADRFVFYPAVASGTGHCPAKGRPLERSLARQQQVAVSTADP